MADQSGLEDGSDRDTKSGPMPASQYQGTAYSSRISKGMFSFLPGNSLSIVPFIPKHYGYLGISNLILFESHFSSEESSEYLIPRARTDFHTSCMI